MPVFHTPVAYTLPRVTSRTRGVELAHFSHYSPLPVGQSVLKLNGTWVQKQTPTVTETQAATYYFAGGHIHPVTYRVAAELEAAGYGSNLTYSDEFSETFEERY